MTPPRIDRTIEAAALRLSRSGNPALDAETLFRGLSGMSRAALLAQGSELAPAELVARFETAVGRRARGEPVQYILGAAAFWRDEFIVNDAVLIPRPETELLVEVAASRLHDLEGSTILDLGTGSGCIALSLLREAPSLRAVAVDVSRDALAVAARNAARLGLADRVELRISAWFEAVEPTETFEAIVSNPPYVTSAHAPALSADVRDFEPAIALFADPADDLSSYRPITAGAARHLKPSGLLAVEVGLGQADRVARLFAGAGFRAIEIRNDLAGIPRLVLGERP